MTATAPVPLAQQQHLLLHGMPWSFYEDVLSADSDGSLRVTFDSGNVEIMAPLHLHEKWKSRIGRLVEALSEELDIEVEACGSTTFRRENLGKGLEPDECYYVQHAHLVHAKDELDLQVDPPPDLAIEVEITRRSIPRQPIYAALGVPELWRFDGKRLTVMRLRNGQYEVIGHSEAFPMLRMSEFESFLLRLDSERQTRVLREFRRWLRTLPV